MNNFDRRSFIAGSVSALAVTQLPDLAMAATAPAACVTSGLPPFAPNSLTVDCASRLNFEIYRKNAAYMGLAGCVSMTQVQGKYGTYAAGNLFLFPWLNPKGQALGAAKQWQSVMPISATKYVAASPIPNWRMPLDEYFLRYVLEAPQQSFIGFRVGAPVNLQESRRPWFTNIPKLQDGSPAGVAWTSSNLNNLWFAGSRWIPNDDTCGGNKWRALIVHGLHQASVRMC